MHYARRLACPARAAEPPSLTSTKRTCSTMMCVLQSLCRGETATCPFRPCQAELPRLSLEHTIRQHAADSAPGNAFSGFCDCVGHGVLVARQPDFVAHKKLPHSLMRRFEHGLLRRLSHRLFFLGHWRRASLSAKHILETVQSAQTSKHASGLDRFPIQLAQCTLPLCLSRTSARSSYKGPLVRFQTWFPSLLHPSRHSPVYSFTSNLCAKQQRFIPKRLLCIQIQSSHPSQSSLSGHSPSPDH